MKKWFAVIGDPIQHSKSPDMHNTWYTEMNLDASYVPVHVTPENLAAAVAAFKTLGASGFNVTIPHKQAIIPLLDDVDPVAEKMGAVNTVVRTADGRLKGFNTDGDGFVRSLEASIGHQHKNAELLVIGAGGAARGIVHALHAAGYQSITVANRTVTNAQTIIDEVGHGKAITLTEAEQALADYKIFIQTTPAGLANGNFSTPFAMDKFPNGAIVADIVYNPLMTPFLQAAEKKEAKIVNGLGMFVHQGAIAFEHWFGESPNTENMIALMTAQLNK